MNASHQSMRNAQGYGRIRGSLLLLIFLVTVGLAAVCRGATSAAPITPSAPIAFGTLQTEGEHAAEEYAGGVRIAMMEIFWDRYEPDKGRFSAAYAAEQRQRLARLKAIGFRVTLALGAYDPPPWLAREPNAKFVNQNGAVSADLNYVFNQKMRGYFERYLARVDADLGLENFWAIRITSGGNAELLYPGGGAYWAFDGNAQNGPDRPADLPRCPFPGWKPGQPGLSTAQVRRWADWYVLCLALTADWQMRALDHLGFTGWRQILTPGSGARPSVYEDAVNHRLPDGIVGVGAVWHKLYEFLPDKRRAVVYVSSVADLSGHDDVTQPEDGQAALADPVANNWSATRWLVRIAHEYGLPVGGENPGYNAPPSLNAHYVDSSPSGMMARSLAQAEAGRFQCFYWAHSDRLWDGTKPFSEFASAIATANATANDRKGRRHLPAALSHAR
jgi:hypothetical protein